MKMDSKSAFMVIFGIVLIILSIFTKMLLDRWGVIALIEIISILGVIILIYGLFVAMGKKKEDTPEEKKPEEMK